MRERSIDLSRQARRRAAIARLRQRGASEADIARAAAALANTFALADWFRALTRAVAEP